MTPLVENTDIILQIYWHNGKFLMTARLLCSFCDVSEKHKPPQQKYGMILLLEEKHKPI